MKVRMMEWATIVGNVPSKANSYRIITINGHHQLGKTTTMQKYERNFYMQMGAYRNLMIDGYFELYIDVYYPSMRSDLDNSLKIVLDCLQKGGAIKNDNLCVEIHARKFVDKTNPRIDFLLRKIEL